MNRKKIMLRRALQNDCEIMMAMITILVKLGSNFGVAGEGDPTIQLLKTAVTKTTNEL